jgi:hypothetical protein
MICGEPLPQGTQNAFRIPRILATDDGIVRVAVEGDLPSTMPFHHRFEPRIEHLMGEDIGQDGTVYTAPRLWGRVSRGPTPAQAGSGEPDATGARRAGWLVDNPKPAELWRCAAHLSRAE